MVVSRTGGPATTIRCKARVFAEQDSEEALVLSTALGVMLTVVQQNGRWVAYALAHEATDGNPGDCLFVPPACLMDLDEADPAIAKRWKLVLGRLTSPDDGSPFLHCWLELGEAVVSVSNLQNDYPAYAKARIDYYQDNGLLGDPMYVSARALRVAGRRLGGGSQLAKWLAKRAGGLDA